MGDFRLRKWYIDVTDQSSARCFIGYAAALTWRSFNLHYLGYTFLNSDRKIVTRNFFVQPPLPIVSGETLQWTTSEFSGEWVQAMEGNSELLLGNGDREIMWDCLQPLSHARMTLGKDSLIGLGYVERITLSFLPWELPIEQLYWGRFLTNQVSLTWIRWVGPIPKVLILFNGRRYEQGLISEIEIRFDECVLTLHDSIALRSGDLKSNVFGKVPAIAKLFPASIMRLQEQKWMSQGKLIAGNQEFEGKAIHELVLWM